MATTIYIAGQMTGIPDFNRPAFYALEARLKKRGCKVLNPAKIGDLPQYEMHKPICRAMLDGADAVWFLPGWEESKGARAEYEYAKAHGLPCFFEPERGWI